MRTEVLSHPLAEAHSLPLPLRICLGFRSLGRAGHLRWTQPLAGLFELDKQRPSTRHSSRATPGYQRRNGTHREGDKWSLLR